MMTLPKRKNLRLRSFDYRSNVAYFVTICIERRHEIFGSIFDDQIRLSQCGHIARDCLAAIPEHNPHVEVETFVIMPNHVLAILVLAILLLVGATYMSPAVSGAAPNHSAPSSAPTKPPSPAKSTNAAPAPAPIGGSAHFTTTSFAMTAPMKPSGNILKINPRRWHEDELNSQAQRLVSMSRWIKGLTADAGDMYVAPTKKEEP